MLEFSTGDVPEMTPLAASVAFGGNVPEYKLYVSGASPVAIIDCVYGFVS